MSEPEERRALAQKLREVADDIESGRRDAALVFSAHRRGATCHGSSLSEGTDEYMSVLKIAVKAAMMTIGDMIDE